MCFLRGQKLQDDKVLFKNKKQDQNQKTPQRLQEDKQEMKIIIFQIITGWLLERTL